MANPRISNSSLLRRTQRQLGWGEEGQRQTADARTAANGNHRSQVSDDALQDMFWHDHYHLQPYYVNGRGYDQYRPAYEMGWKAAAQFSGDFASVAAVLEEQWPARSAGSLLSWRQVCGAVQAAWERVRHAEMAVTLSQLDLLALLQGLQRLNQQTLKILQMATLQLPSGLLQQMLQRHIRAFESASAELAHEFSLPAEMPGDRRFPLSFSRGWETIKSAMRQPSLNSLLNASEEAEQLLAMAYRTALRESLPEAARTLLQRQAMAVQRGIEALHWLRSCLPAQAGVATAGLNRG